MKLYTHPGRLMPFLFFFLMAVPMAGQGKNHHYQTYIKQYGMLAVQHRDRYRIPASITLAQGILESGAGRGELAQRSNNHFGIKCHTNWQGERVYHDDDRRGECFRKYTYVEESYDDHSRFLSERPRYAGLFGLSVTDYAGWARGLQRCGYATDKSYAGKLIDLIETYKLYRYDTAKASSGKQERAKKSPEEPARVSIERLKYQANGLKFVLAGRHDTYASLAKALRIKESKLLKYNEVPKGFRLQAGSIVYLQKKKKTAGKAKEHIVHAGESMHGISQKYGILMKSLYKASNKRADYIPLEGDVLRLP